MTAQNPNLAALSAAGVSVWLDDLSRERLRSGNLQELIDTKSVVGVTTNPSIFQKAFAEGDAYDSQIAELAERGADVDATIRTVTTDDVRNACDVLTREWENSDGVDGRCPSRSTPGWRATPTRPSLRPSSCGRSSTGRTCSSRSRRPRPGFRPSPPFWRKGFRSMSR
ncbi:transaldolase family protein [Mycobacterium intracellulare 1956]|uniref:Transaldolase family protein n=1 Tax=Mycobacterium intracellulare 1956 TaxID=1299331 RepID=X8CFJ9_MYCIT|nr:transaldolase family protein [Mycobacterium intracellulare 1956]